MDLILWRHAEALDAEDGANRALTARGNARPRAWPIGSISTCQPPQG
jgi:phosphohistidine phosphatase SixA